MSSILGLGRSPGEGHDNPLQYSCLGNPMDRGAWWATVHRMSKRQTRLSGETTTNWNTTLLMIDITCTGKADFKSLYIIHSNSVMSILMLLLLLSHFSRVQLCATP